MSNYNGRANASHVYEWHDDTGPRYVGWGTIGRDGSMPWERRWAARADDRSELGQWLAQLSSKPKLDWRALPSVALDRGTARALARWRRKQLRAAGVVLLHDREYHGSGPRRPVLGYPSLRAAANALRIPVSTVWDRLRRGVDVQPR